MKLYKLSLMLATCSVMLIAGCSGDKPGSGNSISKTEPVTTENKFNVPPGADPTIADTLGGKGFELVADKMGWKTGTISKEDMKYVADVNAKKGGQVSFALIDFPATFRSMGKDENTATTRMVHQLVYEPLITTNPLTLEFLPVLATHWKISDDKQTFFYRINPNARFSDGHPVTTDDVVATDNLGRDSTILSPYTNSFYAEFDKPEVISKYIFKVHSKKLNWKNMLYYGGLQLLPAHIIKGMSGRDYLTKFQYDMMPGSGPYIILPKDVKKPQSLTLTRVANWWGHDDPLNVGQNNFDKITLKFIQDEKLTLEKFKKKEMDFYIVARAKYWREEFNYDDIKRGIVQKRKIYTDDPTGFGGFGFNTREEPFNDPKIREAFICLFNREQLLEKLMFNQYTISDSYEPNSQYQNPNNPKYRYNPEKAAQLLAEAGYTTRNQDGILTKNGKPLEFEIGIDQSAERIVTPVQQDLKKAGVNMKIRLIDGVTSFKMVNERNFKIVYQNWGGLLYPNPISTWQSKLADVKNTNNITGMKNSRIDEICNAEQSEFDPIKRIELLRELDGILMQEKHYALSWYAGYQRIVYWNNLSMPEFGLGKITDWRGILSTWWFDPDKAETVNKGMKDKTVTMPIGETDVKYWDTYNKSHSQSTTTSTAK